MDFLLPQILSDPSWPPSQSLSQLFLAVGLSRGAHYSSCVCGFVMGVVVSPRSSVQLQIRRCPRHGSLAGQRPERQRLQPVGRGRGDERGGQRHLPGAQIVSLTAARAWVTNSPCVTCSLTHQILCYTRNVESSTILLPLFLSSGKIPNGTDVMKSMGHGDMEGKMSTSRVCLHALWYLK